VAHGQRHAARVEGVVEAPAGRVWRWVGNELETTVVVELTPDGSRLTRLAVGHAGLSTEEAASDRATGWSDCLARLPRFLEG
jgi:uncharacterized protein YndB with AHSA1/START domain